jgi:hypothetical protein
VADIVQAYHDAGRRPSNNRFASPPASEPETPAAEQETEEPEAAESPALAEPPPVRRSLGELADELEAFMDAIRSGDNLARTEMLSGAVAT